MAEAAGAGAADADVDADAAANRRVVFLNRSADRHGTYVTRETEGMHMVGSVIFADFVDVVLRLIEYDVKTYGTSRCVTRLRAVRPVPWSRVVAEALTKNPSGHDAPTFSDFCERVPCPESREYFAWHHFGASRLRWILTGRWPQTRAEVEETYALMTPAPTPTWFETAHESRVAALGRPPIEIARARARRQVLAAHDRLASSRVPFEDTAGIDTTHAEIFTDTSATSLVVVSIEKDEMALRWIDEAARAFETAQQFEGFVSTARRELAANEVRFEFVDEYDSERHIGKTFVCDTLASHRIVGRRLPVAYLRHLKWRFETEDARAPRRGARRGETVFVDSEASATSRTEIVHRALRGAPKRGLVALCSPKHFTLRGIAFEAFRDRAVRLVRDVRRTYVAARRVRKEWTIDGVSSGDFVRNFMFADCLSLTDLVDVPDGILKMIIAFDVYETRHLHDLARVSERVVLVRRTGVPTPSLVSHEAEEASSSSDEESEKVSSTDEKKEMFASSSSSDEESERVAPPPPSNNDERVVASSESSESSESSDEDEEDGKMEVDEETSRD